MAEKPRDPNQLLFDDPKDTSGKGIIPGKIAVGVGLHDGSSSGGELWQRTKHLKQADAMALAGFGVTNVFDDWSFEEMNKLTMAFQAYTGKAYSGAKYSCCSC
jgi:hypothetical protein